MIELRHVAKHYGNVTALQDASLEIPEHTSLAILGPSGSGKTTLLRLIAGLEMPDKGEIAINGMTVSTANWALAPSRRGIGFVFQTPALWPFMTVAQNISFGLHRLRESERDRRLQELLRRTHLARLADRYPHQLSAGECRRVALARALAPDPNWLLLDEPLTNLDSRLKAEMITFIKENVDRTKHSLIYVTHDEREVSQIAKRVVRIDEGRLKGTLSKH